MDGMIEMKNMQEEVFDDEEFGLELSENRNGRADRYSHVQTSAAEFHPDDHAEPGSWIRSRIRKQNRWTLILMGVLVATAVVFVAGKVYMSEDDVDALVQPFDRESGTVENGSQNEKQQQAIDKANGKSQSHGHWDGNGNPFASTVNSLNPHNDYTHGYSHKGATIGKFGHNRPGGRPGEKFGHNPIGGGGSGSVAGQTPSQPPAETVDEKDVYCEDLSRYEQWYNSSVSKDDGPQFRVINQFDHDRTAFTQGLTYARGKLFESTGRYGKSTVRVLDPDSINVLKMVPMDDTLFGEGMTYYKDTLVQITWKARKGFIYDMTTLETIDKFQYSSTKNEGWGITWDRCKDELIMTDGSHFLHTWDPATMAQKRKIPVMRLNGKKALQLNEIEFWRGRVLANVWYEDVLLVIHPETGQVEKEYDFSTLWPANDRSKHQADVFNGISVSNDPNVLYVTGKNWDRMFTIELLPSLQ